MVLIIRDEDYDRDENDSLPEDYDSLFNSYSSDTCITAVANTTPDNNSNGGISL